MSMRACPRAWAHARARGRSRPVRRETTETRGFVERLRIIEVCSGTGWYTPPSSSRRGATTHWWQATDRGRINSAGLAALRRIRHCYRLIKSSRRARRSSMRLLGGKLAFAALVVGKHCGDQYLVDAGDFILRFNHIIGRTVEENFAECFVKFQISFLLNWF